MLALRQVHTNLNQKITIQLPPEFDNYREVEVIVLPVESDSNKALSTKEFIKRFADVIPDSPDIGSSGTQFT